MPLSEAVAIVIEAEHALYARRKLAGITLTEAAERSGIGRERIARIEKGEGGIRMTEFVRLTRVLEIPPGELISAPYSDRTRGSARPAP